MADSTPYDVAEARRALLDGLRRAHDRHCEQRMVAAIDRGLARGLHVLFTLGIAYFVWRVACGLIGLEPWLGGWVVFGLVLVIAAVPFVRAILDERARDVPVRDAAERLDRAAGSRGRIAAALDLSARPAGAFEAAAIADGAAALERARDLEPEAPVRRLPSIAEYAGAYVGALALVLATYLPIASGATEPNPPVRVATGAATPVAPRADEPEPASARAQRPAPRRPEPTAAPLSRRAERTGGVRRPSPSSSGDLQKASGRMGQGKSGRARRARRASSARGTPSAGDTGKGQPEPKRPPRPPKKPKRDPADAKVLPRKRPEQQRSGATVGQAGSGGGTMSPIDSPWSQRDRGDTEPLPENDSEEDIDEEIEEEEARSGTQPKLRDRRSATSRDLSIGGPGEGGDGRGGPSPQKKSRGTASLVLGVPVPDFVRGLLNPGTTKVTHERVEPVASPGAARTAAAVAPRTRPEPPVAPVRVDPSVRRTIQTFLSRFHHEVERARRERGAGDEGS